MKRSKPKAIWRKRRERIDNWWSEVDVFRNVCTRGYCDLTRVWIHEPKSYCFAHILPKGMYPELRLLESNIVYVATIELHEIVDKLTRWIKQELYQKILDGTAIDFIRWLYNAHNVEG